ncbi:MAG TPA: hypothetical protein VG734_17400 [Lacunisphaera sp.]|nr:hypothetical protein [Lacunisphaera sp.]
MKALALAIGISSAPRLSYLAGAVNGARDFQAWAVAMGYTARLLTDEDAPVTIPRLEQELKALLQGAPCDRLLIYYAGHGLIRELEEGLWLLSDWETGLRAVAVEVLKRRLYQYGIKQIGIFADACRCLPSDVQAADLTADGVLGKGPRAASQPEVDKFIATQDGDETFAIPGDNPEDDRCLFSGVLLEGLWGTQPSAFSVTRADKVTSGSLGKYLKTEVPKRAAVYGLAVNPTVVPTFGEGEDVYFALLPRRAVPVFPAWPPPSPPETSAPYSGGVRKVMGPPDQILLDDNLAKEEVVFARESVPSFARRLREQKRPDHFETGSGFAIDGEDVLALWTGRDVFAEVHGEPNWWRVGQQPGYKLAQPVPVLIEFANEQFGAMTALPKFIASVQVDDLGVSAVIYRGIDTPPEVATSAEKALSQLEKGRLRATDAADLAITLRQQKHTDPVLGVVGAYLYDAIGDVDNIRRMAYYYVANEQPIPYDIALLGQLVGKRQDNLLHAIVPAIKARKPRTEQEKYFGWTHNATPQVEGIVGGCWPWLRQGWAFLDDPADDGSNLILPGLLDVRPHLTTARFATLNPGGAMLLARIFGLTPQKIR